MKTKILLLLILLLSSIAKNYAGTPANSSPLICSATVNVVSNVSCYGKCDGALIVNPTGGAGPYSYLWNPTGSTTQTVSNLCAGTYSCLVTDAGGCTSSASVTLTQPNVLNTVIDSIKNVVCNGETSGKIYTSTSGGAGNYTYSWTPSGATTQNLIRVAAGTYTLHVTDANGCTLNRIATLTQPGNIGPLLSIVATPNDVGCFGYSDGWIVINSGALGGTPPYSYSWSTGASTPTINNLYAGSYTVIIYDYNGCSADSTLIIAEPPALTATVNILSNISCNGKCDGALIVNPTGGTAPYTYLWSPTGSSAQVVSNLCAGTYSCLVTDANGCSSSGQFTLTQPNVLNTVIDSVKDVGCHYESSGKIYTSTSGGTPVYNYSWTSSASTNANLIGVTAGTYTLNVTDAHGCTSSSVAVVIEPDTIVPLVTNMLLFKTNVRCFGNSDGTIDVDSVIGGTPPYAYSWSTGAFGDTISNLPVGSYSVTVLDDNGCSLDSTIMILEPSAVNVLLNVTNASCFTCNDGSISAMASGGVAGYTYSWIPTGGISATISNLLPGTYTCCVTDANGCSSCNTTVVSNSNCSANFIVYPDTIPQSWIAANQAVGVNPISYLWHWGDGDSSTGAYPSHIYNTAGYYNICLTIIDSTGCTNTYCDSSTYLNRSSSGNAIITINVVDPLITGTDYLNVSVAQFIIYPNPSTNIFTISFSETMRNTSLKIFNLIGEEVYGQTVNVPQGEKETVNTKLPSGIYFVQVRDEERLWGEKIVVE